MINKKNLWFLTLFSLVLVLSIYYVTMPNELFVTNNDTNLNNEVDVSIEESDVITALKVDDDNAVLEEITSLKETLTNKEATIDQKNLAFEELKKLNNTSAKEETLENKIKTTYELDSFVKIDGDQIRVVVGSDDKGVEVANNIMRAVQGEFDNKMYISVKFQT